MQNYTNYKVVIIDDASTDQTPDLIQAYIDFYNIPSSKI
jgi:glycosyltransferase involved in cell wall biosynthesis